MISFLFRFFVLVFPLGLFAGVVCTPQPDGSWICSGDGGASGGGGVTTNIVGVCTNCTAMTPDECQLIKNSIQSELYGGMQALTYSQEEVNYSLDAINAVLQEGDSFAPVQAWSSGSSPSFSQVSQSQYVLTAGGSDQVTNVGFGGSGNNSIVNYYQQAVKPPLESAKTHLEESLVGIRSSYDTMNNLQQNLVSQIDCTACTASFDDDPVVTNSPPASGSACPCDEQLKALQKLVKDEFLPRIKSIDANVKMLTNIVTIAREQFEVVKEGMHNITNLLTRLDDYVLDDFSNRVYQIRYDVNFIASNLAQRVKQAESFISTNYWNAVHYLDNDDQRFSMAELKEVLVDEDNTEGNRFDFAEFEKLPWFTRIEFLLTDIAGYYDKTNDLSDVEKVERKIADLERSSSSDSSSISNTIATLGSDNFSSISSSLSALWDNFSFFGSGSSTIEGVEVIGGDVSGFFGQEIASIHIKPFDGMTESIADYNWIIEVCRYAFQAFYLAGFSFVLFKLVAFLYLQIGKVVSMLLKLYSAIFGS